MLALLTAGVLAGATFGVVYLVLFHFIKGTW